MNIFKNFNFEKVRGILLDLDGTVYEYDSCHKNGLLALYKGFSVVHSIPYDLFCGLYSDAQKAVKERTNGQGASHSRLLYIQHMLEQTLRRTDVETVLTLEEIYWSAFMDEMKLKEGVSEFLAECEKRGVIVCIITDLTTAIQFRKIGRLGLSASIDFVVTSEEAGVEKPSPLIFSYAIEKMGLQKEDVIMIGDDSKKDIDGARNINIRAVKVT